MYIAGVDVKTSKILAVRELRKKAPNKLKKKGNQKETLVNQQLLMRKVYHLQMKTVNLLN